MKKLLNYFQPNNQSLIENDYYQLKNSRLLVNFMFVVLIISLIFAILNITSHKHIASTINLLTFSAILCNLFLYKKTARYTLAVSAFLTTCSISSGILISVAPLGLSSNLVWFPLLIVVAIYMLGVNKGLIQSFVIAVISMTAISIYHSKSIVSSDIYSSAEILQFNLAIILFSSFAAFFMASRILKEEAEITQKIQTQKDILFELNESHSVLLSIVGHDIANPLTVVKHGIKSCKMKIQKGDFNIEKQLEMVERNAHRIEQLINSVKKMRAMEDGKLSITLRAVNLFEAVEESINQFEQKAMEKGILFERNYSEGENILVQSDQVSLTNSVINNLLSNALKFSEPGGIVKINIFANHSNAYLQVSDQGAGIPKEIRSYLFDSRRPTTRVGTAGEAGTGLGLPILKMFIEKYEAKVEVNSVTKLENPSNYGTTFSLNFIRLYPSVSTEDKDRYVA